MAYQVRLPKVGESVTEAVIGKWLKRPGDHVEKYDPLVEVVTDKINMEFPAPESGTLTAIMVEDGATVPMGAVIAEMAPDAEAPSAGEPPDRATAARQEPERVDRIGRIVSGANVGPTGGVFSDASLPAPGARASAPEPPRLTASGQSGKQVRRKRYSPVVMRLAAEHSIDVSALEGTGRGGRVTKRDVLAAVERRRKEARVAPARKRTAPGGEPGRVAAGDAPPGEDRIVEPSPVRKIIAANMARSAAEIPHAWTTVEADVTGLVELRAQRREQFEARHAIKLTYLPFSVAAVAAALRANPLVNSSWENGKIRIRGRVNVGVAVAAPDGLVAPVVRDADRLTVRDIALALAPLIERARAGELTLDDVSGGTFTLNNTGALGSAWGGAIINYPQAAIVNTEAIIKRPVVVSGPGGDAIAIRSIMNLCLSFDHRVIDGAEASQFVHDVKRGLEAYGPGSSLD